MKRNSAKICTIIATLLLITVTVLEIDAHARAGGGRTFGSRGTTYSQPSRTYSQPSPYRDQTASPYRPSPYQQQGGGFLRGLAGGIVGGIVGGMLFRSLGFAGGGGAAGGIGIFDIVLILGILYLIYRFIKKKRAEAPIYETSYSRAGYEPERVTPISTEMPSFSSGANDVETGLTHIRQMDPCFDENRFSDGVMDIFFKVQGAWMNRDLSPVDNLLSDEMRRILREDADTLLREKRINRLENIAVRNVEIVEAWQESGQDFVTARIYANLLDYTTDETTHEVVSGSKTDPVKFEEYWTFTRAVGNNPWRLTAISQS